MKDKLLIESDRIYSFKDKEFITPEIFLQKLQDFAIIPLGENHGNAQHYITQKKIIEHLSTQGPVDVGLECLDWTKQPALEQYQDGIMDESAFLEAVNWADTDSFTWYRPLIRTAKQSGGMAYGLNCPWSLTRNVVKVGLDNLSEEDKSLLPPDFETGGPAYYERFKKTMNNINHPTMGMPMENFFCVHSIWDDTMAFRTLMNRKNTTPFFVIVGNFHITYKLGLPARIEKRSPEDISTATVTQVDSTGMDETEILSHTQPHPVYGDLADFIIFSHSKESTPKP